MDRFNYYRLMVEELSKIDQEHKPSLLLHSCCGPCNCYPMVLLQQYFKVTLYFNNSNIYPYEEYNRRFIELDNYRLYFNNKYQSSINMIKTNYDYSFQEFLSPYGEQKEGSERCKICIEKRMKEAYQYAFEHKYDYFTTVMSISRQKDEEMLNEIGLKLQEQFKNTKYLIADFKKKGGIDQGLVIAKELNMYRQTYCGCRFSKKD